MKNFHAIEERIGHHFFDQQLLKTALTHRTFARERNLDYDNQRLEFLGDAVLQLLLSDALYFRHPEGNEGFLTKVRAVMVREPTLAKLARYLDLGSAMLLGRGELENGGAERDSLLSDVFEAVVGAIYLDAGIDITRMLVLGWMQELFPDLSVIDDDNPKGNLQELAIKYDLGTVVYEDIKAIGPDHAREYTVRVRVRKYAAEGMGSKRKKAQAEAARALLDVITQNHPDYTL